MDGVAIPDGLAQNYSMTGIPGAGNETVEEPAGADNETSAEANATTPGAPAPAPAPAPKSSAGVAVASLLAVPTLLAVLLL